MLRCGGLAVKAGVAHERAGSFPAGIGARANGGPPGEAPAFVHGHSGELRG